MIISPRLGKVIKTYHAKYLVEDEVLAYHELARVTEKTAGVRTPTITHIDLANNSIELEFVSGKLLSDQIPPSVFAETEWIYNSILNFLGNAYEANCRLDLDPTNIIVCSDTNELVIIDPVCDPCDRSNFTANVYFWGLVKAFGRRFNIFRVAAFRRWWLCQLEAYLSLTGVTPHEFFLDLAAYIDRVIRWNLGESSSENGAMRIWRRVVLVPVLRLVAAVFRTKAKVL